MADAPWYAVFRTDLREVLRDRRTLFINLILPMLLYPVMTLVLVQVAQIAAASPRPPPRVAVIGEDGDLIRALTGVTVVPVAPGQVAGLTSTDDKTALGALRALDLTALLVVEGNRLELRRDDANARLDRAQGAIDAAIQRWQRARSETALRRHGLDPGPVLDPVTVVRRGLAPVAESLRTRLAGLIPLLLVVLAVSGALHPAVDLLAGERERGTLETLLSLPVRRRDLFLGKLLVVLCAAGVAVVFNLLSLGLTAGLLGAQVASSTAAIGLDASALAGVGLPTLGLCLLLLLPLLLTIGAIALALSAVASSAKEAHNHLAPLLLVVTLLAGAAALPDLRPGPAVDLIPVTGAVVVLKAALEDPARVPWMDLALVLVASLATATVVVAWAIRLLEREDIRFPGLVRAGWGRWRRWGDNPGPGGLEALGLVALAAGGMTVGAGLFAHAAPATQVAVPLMLYVGGPALAGAWLGGWRPQHLFWTRPDGRGLAWALAIAPLALGLTALIGFLQSQVVEESHLKPVEEQIRQVLSRLQATGGLPLVLLCTALAPAICEELLFRGPVLAGLRRAVGPAGAVVLSGVLFAALHQSPYRFVPQALLGMLLAVLTLRTGSVVPAMVVHGLHNGVLVLLVRP